MKDKNMSIPRKAIDIVALIILCFMSLQPLKGSFVKFIELQDIYDNFFLKSNIIRTTGLIALIIAILLIILREHVSVKGTLKDIFYKKPWNICFVLFMIWMLVSYTQSVSPYISIYGEAFRYEGMIAFFAYAGFFALASFLKNPAYKRFWMHFTIGVSTVLGIFTLIRHYGDGDFVLSYMNNEPQGTSGVAATFLQYNHYAYYLCVIIMLLAGLFLLEKNKVKMTIYGVLLFFHQYLLALNETRGGYIAIIVGMVFLSVIFRIRKEVSLKRIFTMCGIVILACVLAGGVFLAAFFSIFGDSFKIISNQNAADAGSGRWKLWGLTLEIIKERPIFGCGPNMVYYYMTSAGTADLPHNEYLQIMADFGIPGGLLYLGGLLTLFINCIKNIRKLSSQTVILGCTALAYGVSAFFGVTIPLATPFFYIVLAMTKEDISIENGETEKKREERTVD